MSFLIGTIAGVAPGAAGFTGPSYSAIDSSGNLFVVDTGNFVIRKITPAGVVTVFAGSPGNGGYIDATGSAARFNLIQGLCIDSSDNLFVANPADDTIRKITPAGVVTTFAGTPGVRATTDGTGAAASFWTPYGLAIDSSNNIYVSQKFDYTIRRCLT
jgi:sugar lactone lactonase YvrE